MVAKGIKKNQVEVLQNIADDEWDSRPTSKGEKRNNSESEKRHETTAANITKDENQFEGGDDDKIEEDKIIADA